MEMCPYCGEEVPQDSSKCWKCGTELSEGTARAEGDELEVPDEEEEDGKTVLIECPWCGEAVPKKALTCRECGRRIQRARSNAAAALLWKWGVWAVVLIVGATAGTAVVLYSQRRAVANERSAKSIGVAFEVLNQRLQPLNKSFKEERRQEVWEKDFKQRIVHWTDGVVDEIDPAARTVKIVHTHGQKKPDVIVTFLPAEDLQGLNVGEKIEYSARLVGYGQDGFAFTLADGMLDKK